MSGKLTVTVTVTARYSYGRNFESFYRHYGTDTVTARYGQFPTHTKTALFSCVLRADILRVAYVFEPHLPIIIVRLYEYVTVLRDRKKNKSKSIHKKTRSVRTFLNDINKISRKQFGVMNSLDFSFLMTSHANQELSASGLR